MKQSVLLLLVATLATPACGDDNGGCELPAEPQLTPPLIAQSAGVLGFPLARLTEQKRVDAVFSNGGCAPLEIDVASLRLEGPNAAEFEIGTPNPENGRAQSRGAIGIPITFTSPGRGIYFATVAFSTNAENFADYELDLVAPATDARIPDEADIEMFEDPVVVGPSAALGFDDNDNPREGALVRFYNLGGRSLSINDYSLADPTNFSFFAGTAQPSAACTYDAICGPGDGAEKGCCEGGLSCRCLEFAPDGQTCNQSQCANVNVTSGQFSILAVEHTAASGSHQTELEISSNDPDTPVASVTITGTK